ncbi:hypothetical protein NSK_006213 [Nannochloropsis salina CCMP1776]|uniref:Uncharacterized protein n=1 Tax=Nannochloropsis salina CCMP1776 TaxID=1027361 RepID=A0A4D9D1I0_9STRA|nr:hypothetical protein NSK_006213 [Nannochloropsis salina CCMP1776]|eukprot:TFJ82469.1 hypothetical protein NSK_006213 [Nannochloropsis salina CCMP1776]
MVKASLCILSLAAVAQGFLLPVPAPHRPPSSTQLAASAFTTVSGRIVEDPKGELQKVLTPSPKDEARRARVAKVLEAAGLQYTGEAIFSSNRWYGGAVYRDFTDAVGVEPADQVGAAALIVAAGNKGYKPFHKKVGTFMEVLHSLVKTILAEKDEFEGADLAKVFTGLVKLGYEGSPKQLIRDLVREITARIEAGELTGTQIATVLDSAASYWFTPEDAFFAAVASKLSPADVSDQDKARVKDAVSRFSSRLPHLESDKVLPASFVSSF